MPLIILNKAQLKSLMTLLDVLCLDEPDTGLLYVHICRFRDFVVRHVVTVDMDREKSGDAYQLWINIPLDSKTTGFIKIYFWRNPTREYSVSMSSSDSHDFAIHRHVEGKAWESLQGFFQEMDRAIAA